MHSKDPSVDDLKPGDTCDTAIGKAAAMRVTNNPSLTNAFGPLEAKGLPVTGSSFGPIKHATDGTYLVPATPVQLEAR